MQRLRRSRAAADVHAINGGAATLVVDFAKARNKAMKRDCFDLRKAAKDRRSASASVPAPFSLPPSEPKARSRIDWTNLRRLEKPQRRCDFFFLWRP